MTGDRHDRRSLWTLAFGVAALSLLLPLARPQAQILCSKPLQPLCSTDIQSLTGAAERKRCLDDTGKYLDELRGYRACLQDAIEKADAALKQGEAFKSCLESGGQDCSLKDDGQP